MKTLLVAPLCAGCLLEEAFDEVAPTTTPASSWIVQLGIPDQQAPWSALTDLPNPAPDPLEPWLEQRPRVVLSAGGASLAVRFSPADEFGELRLEGLFDTGDQVIHALSYDPAGTSGLDHDLSFSVDVTADDGTYGHHFVAVDFTGRPGCGGRPFPRSVEVFDADRQPLPWDGEELVVAGVRIALVVPPHDCVVAQ